MGEIRELKPNTNVKLNMLDPTTFPSASSVFPFRAAMTLVANSGKDVPSATANKAMNAFDIPHPEAITTAESTNK